ncbi:MAG: hypothetical protein AAFX58_11175 [Pseudomonadota bacterium]
MNIPPIVWLILFIAAVLVYTGFRIRALKKESDRQWRDVDHSKLREWENDDDWGSS